MRMHGTYPFCVEETDKPCICGLNGDKPCPPADERWRKKIVVRDRDKAFVDGYLD